MGPRRQSQTEQREAVTLLRYKDQTVTLRGDPGESQLS